MTVYLGSKAHVVESLIDRHARNDGHSRIHGRAETAEWFKRVRSEPFCPLKFLLQAKSIFSRTHIPCPCYEAKGR